MVVCWQCGRWIRASMVLRTPLRYFERRGIDLNKAYHPRCYKKAEQEAARTLHKL